MALNYISADGIANGTAVTSGNYGFSTVYGNAVVSDEQTLYGSKSFKLVNDSSANNSFIVRSDSAVSTTIGFQCYIYLTGYPSQAIQFMRVDNTNADTGGITQINLNTNGTAYQKSLGWGTEQLPLNEWIRLDVRLDKTAGTFGYYAYNLSDTLIQSCVVSGITYGTSTPGQVAFGKASSGTMAPMYISRIAIDSSAYDFGKVGLGSASQSLTLTESASGTSPVLPIPTGTATLSLDLAASVEGTTKRSGSSSASLSLSSLATGHRSSVGSALANLDLAVSAEGKSNRQGTAESTLRITISAHGVVDRSGSANHALIFSSSAEGQADKSATGTQSLHLSASASGYAPSLDIPTGSALLDLHVSQTAVGSTDRHGVATTTLTLSQSATGTTQRVGTASQHLLLTTSAVGTSVGKRNITVSASIPPKRYRTELHQHTTTTTLERTNRSATLTKHNTTTSLAKRVHLWLSRV